MSSWAGSKQHFTNQKPACPRDHTILAQQTKGEAVLDVCPTCSGQFFDAGEMFAAFGINADPSYWDRPETGGVVKPGRIHCPRCHKEMLLQDLAYGGVAVEIDRCPGCQGVWLDQGEVEKIMQIGDKLAPVLAAEKAAAQAELDKMGDVNFAPGLIARFVGLFRKG